MTRRTVGQKGEGVGGGGGRQGTRGERVNTVSASFRMAAYFHSSPFKIGKRGGWRCLPGAGGVNSFSLLLPGRKWSPRARAGEPGCKLSRGGPRLG